MWSTCRYDSFVLLPDEHSGFYEYEIRRNFSIEDLVKRIIHHQPELKIHLFSPPARGLCQLLPELSQPACCLISHTYKKK